MVTNVERIASHLQGAAAIHRWTVENVPFTESALGYDLFIKIGSDSLAGIALDMRKLCQGLPYPAKQIRQHIAKLVHAGLLIQQKTEAMEAGAAALSQQQEPQPQQPPPPRQQVHGHHQHAQQAHHPHPVQRPHSLTRHADGLPILLATTPQFESLLSAYARESDRVYAVRKNLRDQQLVVADADAQLHDFVDQLYDHFHDLGWMYLHNFGAICFLMTSLVCLAARSHGYRARAMSGYVEVIRGTDAYRFTLGANAPVKPGQIAGHAFCILEESLIVDFGLGNLRRGYNRDFPWGVSCAYRPESPQMGTMLLANGDRVTWKDDWQYPETAAEFAKFETLAAQLVQRYTAAFGTEDHLPMPTPDSSAMALDAVPPANLSARPECSAAN